MASGDTLMIWAPPASNRPSTNFSVPDIHNGKAIEVFALDRNLIIPIEIPNHYDGGGIQIILRVSAATATSGIMSWLTTFERWQTQISDLDADNFDGSKSSTATAPPNTGTLTTVTISHLNSEINGLLKNEGGQLRVRRQSAGNTMSGNARLYRIVLREI